MYFYFSTSRSTYRANAIQPGSNELQIQQPVIQKEARGPGIGEISDSSDLR